MIASNLSAYRTALAGRGPLMGLDVGSKTIGVAFCDAEWTIASAATLIRRTRFTADIARLKALIAERGIKGIVIGLPLHLDGGESPQTQSVRAFARNLEPLGLPILLWDERWSTKAATRALIDADASRARRAALVDKIAAAYILQGAIDALAGGHAAL